MINFTDITLTEMNRSASKKSDAFPAAFDVVIGLSASPPYDWQSIFDVVWKRTFYSSKRNARIEGGNVVITCVPEEVENAHIPMLTKAIQETNAEYRKSLQNAATEKARAKAKSEADEAQLDSLAKKLKDK